MTHILVLVSHCSITIIKQIVTKTMINNVFSKCAIRLKSVNNSILFTPQFTIFFFFITRSFFNIIIYEITTVG